MFWDFEYEDSSTLRRNPACAVEEKAQLSVCKLEGLRVHQTPDQENHRLGSTSSSLTGHTKTKERDKQENKTKETNRSKKRHQDPQPQGHPSVVTDVHNVFFRPLIILQGVRRAFA
jgi:hypothetical protein